MKRGLLVRFNEPLSSGEDSTVDLVVALNRVEALGLWIPNLDRNRWDPSHPERHVELFTSGWPELRQTRQHVVRVAKAHAKQFSEPAVCSFNIAALAWECIELAEPLDRALQRFFDYAATSLAQHLTADPAGVSAPIKVADRNRAVRRFRTVADALDLASKPATMTPRSTRYWLLRESSGSSSDHRRPQSPPFSKPSHPVTPCQSPRPARWSQGPLPA